MEITISEGLTNIIEQEVKLTDTAAAYGSGLIEVFATPAMIALMEKASLHCVVEQLPIGYGTVGTEVNIQHIKATPIGQLVICKAKLTTVKGRKLIFEVEAHDEDGKIGFGTHTRFIIDNNKFMAKLK